MLLLTGTNNWTGVGKASRTGWMSADGMKAFVASAGGLRVFAWKVFVVLRVCFYAVGW